MTEDMVFAMAGVVPLIGGVVVGRRSGLWAGIGAGCILFIVMVLLLVFAGYGY